jgi:hypothetical protein
VNFVLYSFRPAFALLTTVLIFMEYLLRVIDINKNNCAGDNTSAVVTNTAASRYAKIFPMWIHSTTDRKKMYVTLLKSEERLLCFQKYTPNNKTTNCYHTAPRMYVYMYACIYVHTYVGYVCTHVCVRACMAVKSET